MSATLCLVATSCHDADETGDFGTQLDGVWEVRQVENYGDQVISRPYPPLGYMGTYEDYGKELGESWINISDYAQFPSAPIETYSVSPEDEDYSVLMFKGNMVTVLATGNYDMVEFVKKPLPFTVEGNKIKGMLFMPEYTEGSYRIENLTSTGFDLVVDDYGWDKEEFYREDPTYPEQKFENFYVERLIYKYTRIQP